MEERKCAQCGCKLSECDGVIVEDDLLCNNCISEFCITCDHCGSTIWRENCISDEHTHLCRDCFDEHYRTCESCGRITADEDICWHNSRPYCPSCYDELEDCEIEDYSYKPSPVFFGTGNRFFGIELEIDCGGKDNNNARLLKDIANTHHDHVYTKSDGSLDDGFEIVSHPMTLDYHIHEMNWQSVLQKAVSLGYRSHQTSTCGLHIHVNRNAFGENQSDQEDVIARVLYFVELHWNELLCFSRRSEGDIHRWAARYGYEKTSRQILDKAKKGSCGRYAAVNLCNYSTIEFRLFHGTLKYNTFIATLQLVDEICNAALFMSEDELEKQSWCDFVQNITQPELVQYLKERQLYINDTVNAEEDM